MPTPNLTIIIPHHNTPQSLSNLLKQLDTSFPIIVIDNASDTLPIVPATTQLIRNTHNTGFAHACNQGTALAKTDWLLFLNPDITITPDQIQVLRRTAEAEQWDAVSPLLVDTNNEVQWNYHRPRQEFANILTEYSPFKRLLPTSVELSNQTVLPGGCLLIRRNALQEVGEWDERYWLWWEDVDLSERLYKASKRLTVLSSVRVIHQGGESFTPLAETWRKDVFFHSLRIYAHAHFPKWEASLINILTQRFSGSKLYPADTDIRASIIVPNMRREILNTFLETNLKHIDKKDELIVVTSHEFVTELRAQYPDIVFIGLTKNNGFAHTVNTGFRRARGKYLITVNDDTILQKNWVDQMVKTVKEKTGSVSPAIVSPSGIVESIGIHVLPKGKAVPLTGEFDYTVNAFNGAGVLLTRQALEKTGIFDEKFGSYLEDIDLGLRMQRAGFTHDICPNVKITHLKHQTSKSFPLKKSWQDVKNWWLVILKNTEPSQWSRSAVEIFIERGRNISGLLKSFFKQKSG